MTTDVDFLPAPAPCCATAAYLFVLDLDGPALAWEFLRRNPSYGADWQKGAGPHGDAAAARWGLRCGVDPKLDAREVHPVWMGSEDALPHVRPAGSRDIAQHPVFRLWSLPGRKQLLHTGDDLILSAGQGSEVLRACLAPNMESDIACRITAPGDAHCSACRAVHEALVRDPKPCIPQSVSRINLLHMRCLQALDAQQAGKTQRETAVGIFGALAVAQSWHADSELRAQMRHILMRARVLMTEGYLRLAGVRPV